jgi:hypothetical protein
MCSVAKVPMPNGIVCTSILVQPVEIVALENIFCFFPTFCNELFRPPRA